MRDNQAVLDYQLEQAEKKGMEKGMEKGELKKAKETAQVLLSMGLEDSKILQATGLSQTELNELKSSTPH